MPSKTEKARPIYLSFPIQSLTVYGNQQSAAMDVSTINSFPNEILCEIFSHLNLSDRVQYYNRGWRNVAQILVLRSICRRFRDIANQLEFWHQDAFEFRTLMDPGRMPGTKSQRESLHSKPFNREFYITAYHNEEEEFFIRTLLADDNLVPQFARKKSWTFYGYRSFNTVIECLPTFATNTTEITFSTFEYDISMESINLPGFKIRPSRLSLAIRKLSICPQLTALTIAWTNVDVCLECVSQNCRNLKSLKVIEDTCHANHIFEGPDNLPAEPGVLAEFQMMMCPWTERDQYLITEDTVAIFSSPYLSTLVNLSVEYHAELNLRQNSCEEVLDVLTHQLTLLEKLDLVFPMNIAWIDKLGRLKKLKEVTWAVYEDVTPRPRKYKKLRDAANDRFQKALDEFPVKPTIHVAVFRDESIPLFLFQMLMTHSL